MNLTSEGLRARLAEGQRAGCFPAAACAIGLKNEVLAEAFVGNDKLTKELQRWVKRQTAPYKFPRIIDYVSELPRTTNGKVRRVVIREQDAEKNVDGLL